MRATLQRVAHSFWVVFLLPDPIISGRWMVNSGQQCRRHKRRGIDPAWRSYTNEKRKKQKEEGKREEEERTCLGVENAIGQGKRKTIGIINNDWMRCRKSIGRSGSPANEPFAGIPAVGRQRKERKNLSGTYQEFPSVFDPDFSASRSS